MFEKLLLGQRRLIGPFEGGGVVSRVVRLIPAGQLQGQTSADTNRTGDVFISLRHSTSSLRKGDRRINKKTAVILLSSSNSSHSLSFSLAHSAPLSLILKSPSPRNKILLTPPPPHLHNLITKTCREERDGGRRDGGRRGEKTEGTGGC